MPFLGEVSRSPSKPRHRQTESPALETFSVVHLDEDASAPTVEVTQGRELQEGLQSVSSAVIVSKFSSLLDQLESGEKDISSVHSEDCGGSTPATLLSNVRPTHLQVLPSQHQQQKQVTVQESTEAFMQHQNTATVTVQQALTQPLSTQPLVNAAGDNQAGLNQLPSRQPLVNGSAAGMVATSQVGQTESVLPSQSIQLAVLPPTSAHSQQQLGFVHTAPPPSETHLQLEKDLVEMKRRRTQNKRKKQPESSPKGSVSKARRPKLKSQGNVTVIAQELFTTRNRFGIRTSILLPKTLQQTPAGPTQALLPKTLQDAACVNNQYIVMDDPVTPSNTDTGVRAVAASNPLDEAMQSVLPELTVGAVSSQPALVSYGSATETVANVPVTQTSVGANSNARPSPTKRGGRGRPTGKGASRRRGAAKTASVASTNSEECSAAVTPRKKKGGGKQKHAPSLTVLPDLASPQPLVIDDTQRLSATKTCASKAKGGQRHRRTSGKKHGSAKGGTTCTVSPNTQRSAEHTSPIALTDPFQLPQSRTPVPNDQTQKSPVLSSPQKMLNQMMRSQMPHASPVPESEVSLSNHGLLTSLEPVTMLQPVASVSAVPQFSAVQFNTQPSASDFHFAELSAVQTVMPAGSTVVSVSEMNGGRASGLATSQLSGNESVYTTPSLQPAQTFAVPALQPARRPTARGLASQRSDAQATIATVPHTGPFFHTGYSVGSAVQGSSRGQLFSFQGPLLSGSGDASSVGVMLVEGMTTTSSTVAATTVADVQATGQAVTVSRDGAQLGSGNGTQQISGSVSGKASKKASRLSEIDIDKFLRKKVHPKD